MNRRRQRGFTLIELLVGLTLLGLTVVAVTGGLRIGIAGTDRVTERAARMDEMRGVAAFLRERLEAARPVRWSDESGTQLAFVGGAARLGFVSDMPAFPGTGGLYKIGLARDGDRLLLVLDLTEGIQPGFETTDVPPEVLVTDLTALRLDYFGVSPGTSEAQWQESWVDATSLPSLVRIRIATRGSGDWPEIVVAPRLGEQPR